MAWALDLDGVVWLGEIAVPGAASAVSRLQGIGEQVLFVTNNDQLKQQLKESLEQVFAFAKAPELVTLLE